MARSGRLRLAASLVPLVLAGNFLFGSLGINLGCHRMLTHKAVAFQIWVLCILPIFGGWHLFARQDRWHRGSES